MQPRLALVRANFSDLERGLAEMIRVTKPGGRVVVLEITQPTREPLASFYRTWFDRLVPRSARSPATARPTATCRARFVVFPSRRSSLA